MKRHYLLVKDVERRLMEFYNTSPCEYDVNRGLSEEIWRSSCINEKHSSLVPELNVRWFHTFFGRRRRNVHYRVLCDSVPEQEWQQDIPCSTPRCLRHGLSSGMFVLR